MEHRVHPAVKAEQHLGVGRAVDPSPAVQRPSCVLLFEPMAADLGSVLDQSLQQLSLIQMLALALPLARALTSLHLRGLVCPLAEPQLSCG